MAVRNYGPAVRPAMQDKMSGGGSAGSATLRQAVPSRHAAGRLQDLDDDDFDDDEEGRRRGPGALVSAMIVGFLLAAVAIAMCALWYVDLGNGASQPDDLAVAWVGSLASSEGDGMFKYCVRSARNAGVISDTMGVNEVRKLMSDYDVSFQGKSVSGMEKLDALNIAKLEQGMLELYGKKPSIKEATRVFVDADMEWIMPDRGGRKESSVSFRVICIKVNMKWYVYTGRALSEGDVTLLSVPDGNAVGDSFDGNAVEMEQPDPPPEDFKRDVAALEPSDTAVSDLCSGKVKIDGKDFSVPADYKEFLDLFSIESGSECDGMVLKPGTVVARSTVAFGNKDYAGTRLSVGIANPGTEAVNIEDGKVTMLVIGLPPEKFQAYPEVYLPGNVTLGTDLNGVKSVYGNMRLVNDSDAHLIKIDGNAKVYKFQMGGSAHNKIYLYFLDDKLNAIQWDYFDFSSYAGDIA